MRSSLLTRLLALSLVVAAATVAATAWVTTRTTVDRVTGEFARSLEADAFVYTRLLDYATSHPDWSQADPLVEELAARTGRRIVLTTPDGASIFDTARSRDGTTPAVPAVPAALVDAFAPLDQVAGTDLDTPQSSIPRWEHPPPFALSSDDIEAERQDQVDATLACLQDAGIDVDGLDRDDVATGDVSALPDGVVESRGAATCGVYDVGRRPTSTELRIADEIRSTATHCMRDAGVDRDHVARVVALVGPEAVVGRAATAGTDPSVPALARPQDVGGPQGSEPDSAGVDEPSEAGDMEEVVDSCVHDAYRQAYQPYAAEPALLYLDDTTDEGLVARAGGGRLLGALGAVLAVAVGVTVLVGRRLVRPVRDLTDAARRMESGGRHARVDVTGNDDVARLGHAFNAMAASVEATEQQRRAMVSDVAHELRTPLTNLRGYLEAAHDGVVPVDGDLIASLLEESRFVQGLVEDLQQLALADAGQLHVDPEPIDARELAAQVVTAHRARAVTRGVDLGLTDGFACRVHADPGRLRQALGNLVVNAIAYTPQGGRVTVKTDRAGDTVTIAVSDTGVGISPRDRARVFDRFYRVDSSRNRATGGSGLGLAITRSLVEAHGGDITVQSTPGRGSTFTISLPAT